MQVLPVIAFFATTESLSNSRSLNRFYKLFRMCNSKANYRQVVPGWFTVAYGLKKQVASRAENQ